MSDSTNIFEIASREKFRFDSSKGLLTVENLWDLPLTSGIKVSLDAVAKKVNAELKAVTEESFVVTTSNPAKASLETKLEIVKYIIQVRLAENEARLASVKKAAEKEKLLSVLDQKQDAELQDLSKEELLARIGNL